MAYENKDQEVT